MSVELIRAAIEKGAKLFASVSGGKDGQAMTASLVNNGFPIAGLIHADLGRTEWPQSMDMCQTLSTQFDIRLNVVRRSDGLDMLAYWQRRMNMLKGTGKPFWSSAKNRYCTSDLKRGPINVFFTTQHDFIISCEGIRAGESIARGKKVPLSIRKSKTSSYYNDMTVTQAIAAYIPGKRLTLNWYPVFGYSINDVWRTYDMSNDLLLQARLEYKRTGNVPEWWPFHPAYVFGNNRVSCMFCVLGCNNDLNVAAKHNPTLLNELILMEDQGCATFKDNWSLKRLRYVDC